MARTTRVTSDKGLGIGLLFGLLAAGGAVGMLAAPGGLVGAWGFAAAVVAGLILVVAVHLYA
ncbi:DUF7525 family protein [Halalkalicoccus jeotgali]|uniref:Uncharacterized protein n=1 Tax=Halalkalicoccus jeotgali (strain DSM 18796 / CECT 7217 / JCM 14584 / KCTC 4019 / B3) TaxID=795797 RepID=L9VJX8_HALJB|nr:hypothetical protein [Halalkalicoccus jeotgali]ELY36568.1 hypothetical protein C497_11253 [Halalkalicoccus jeotgali B3]